MNTSILTQGKIVIISGPSGAGKSTVVKELLRKSSLPLQLSISATTRPPRPGEIDGRDYYFLSKEEFEKHRIQNNFLECKEVFGRGHWYGTLREPVLAGIREGTWIILEIDVQGALSVLESHPEAISLFIHPGSMVELENRLRKRQTEEEAAILRRLEVAREEMTFKHHYKYEIVNHTVDSTVSSIQLILEQHLQGDYQAC
jgi:guanylate kinase